METFHQRKYAEGGIDRIFVQDNLSHSKRGTIRGLHYQLRHPQGKLVYVITGEIFDVAVDIRFGSPYFGKWVGSLLSSENKRQIFIPEGFAHGFCVMSKTADVLYKCSDLYAPDDDRGLFWADPTIGIDWPIKTPILSKKDSQNPRLAHIPPLKTGSSSSRGARNSCCRLAMYSRGFETVCWRTPSPSS